MGLKLKPPKAKANSPVLTIEEGQIKLLAAFLEERECLYMFIDNVVTYRGSGVISYENFKNFSEREIGKYGNLSGAIDHGFSWIHGKSPISDPGTQESSNYWSEANDDFNLLCRAFIVKFQNN